MKPSNFPARKNQRRIGALYRMEGGRSYEGRGRDHLALTSSITTETEARGIRTKKNRASIGRRRTA